MTPKAVTTALGTVFVEPGRVDVATALVVGQVIDERAPAPPLPPLTVRATVRRAAALVDDTAPPTGCVTLAPGGWWALVGRADVMFPTLAVEAHVVGVEIGAPGFVTARRDVVVPTGAVGFPIAAPAVALRRPAVRIRGRVLADGVFPPVPAPGPLNVRVVAPVGLTGFETPLRTDHPVGTAIRAVNLVPVGVPRLLLRDARPGERHVDILDRTGVAPGGALELTNLRSEQVIVRSVEGPLDPGRPGRIRLTTPLRWAYHAASSAVTVHAVGVAGVPTTLTDSVFAGEVVTFVGNAAVLPDGQPCRLRTAVDPAAEIAVIDAPAGTTDADGYYETGPVGRAAHVDLDAGGAVPTRHVLAYDEPENVVDLSV